MTEQILYPNFFILGVQKGGTSTLHHYLNESSEVFFPSKKELHFFDAYYHKGISWYLNHFKTETGKNYKYAGEATPYYYFHPQTPRRMKIFFPEAKFVVILRNPVERAYSHYQMSVRRGIEKRPFEEAVEKEKSRIKLYSLRLLLFNKFNLSHSEKSYISRGMYFKQLTRWLKYFSLNRFLFLKSEDLFLNPQQEVNKICSFLDISPIILKAEAVVNQGNYEVQIDEKTRKALQKTFSSDILKLEKITKEKFCWF